MRIHIIEDAAYGEAEVTVRAARDSTELREILSALNLVGNSVAGLDVGETCFVPLGDVLYFESVDDRVFFYTPEKTYETPSRLYQVEERLTATPFVRISKSTIVNLRAVTRMRREKNSRLQVTLTTGESLLVSRQYMPVIRHKLEVLL